MPPSAAPSATPSSGLGHIAQVAVLPAFAHARRNSELAALVSGDRTKRRELAKRYRRRARLRYDEFDECLRARRCRLHRAAELDARRVHDPRRAEPASTCSARSRWRSRSKECQQMIAACRKRDVKLMIAYRLHFEAVNLPAIDLARARPARRAEVLQLVVLDDGPARRHPDQAGVWRRHALRHRRLLHQRGALPVSRRADAGVGGLGQQRRGHAGGDRRNDGRDRCDSATSASPRSSRASMPPTSRRIALSALRVDLHADPAYEYAEGLEYT